MRIMIEMSVQQLEKQLSFQGEEMIYPTHISFNGGEVIIQWNEEQQNFYVEAHNKDHQTQKEIVYLQTVLQND